PIVNLETDSILQQKQSKTPKIEFDESIPLIEDFEQQPKSEKENYYLLGIYGYYLGRMLKIKHPETKIGRDKKLNDIVIKKNSKGKIDQSVSRRQATITYKNNKYYVTDKRSKSRTYVNQNKLDIDEEIQINPGDEIEIVSERKSHILRMVKKGNWDFSFPKKAGTWYIRHRIKSLNILSVIFITLASFILVSSFISKNKITQRPDPLTVDETVWYAEDIAAKSIKKEASQFIGYPAIADFDGDKTIDLIYVDPDGFLKCIDGRSHQPLWINHDFQAISNIPLTIVDLNQNAKPDVIVVSKDLRVRVIDGTWGIEIWKSPILAGPLTGPPVVGDFDGDGLKDIAIASTEKVVYIGYSSVKNARWLKVNMEAPTRAIASTADLTDDGILNILIGTETGKIVEIDGFLQRTEEKLDINEELNKAIGSFYQDNQIRYPVALGDLNGDTIQDLIVGSVQGNLIALNGATLERLWYDTFQVNTDLESTFNHSIALGDLDGDKLLDIIALTPDGNLCAFKGRGQGKDRKMVLWEKSTTENGPFVGSPVLADFNKNGTQDVVISNNAGNIYIFEGTTGEILWKSKLNGSTLIGVPLIGDLDNDHHLDILALKSDGKFYKLLTNSLISDNALVWGQMFGNSRHTNSSFYQAPDVSNYYVYILIAVMADLIIIGLHFVFRQKRKKLSQILVTP
ncbi:MAG: FG-GAP-like repeat-containing protein, partial [bacterium]